MTDPREACFRPGDHVRVRPAYSLGHARTPFYVRGRSGIVERICGRFPNPEELAYARAGLPALPLYRVQFRQRELWPDYAGHPADVLVAEIYEHWLEAEDDVP